MIIFDPKIKAVINLSFGLITGLLISALINTLSINNEIKWILMFSKREFWILIFIFILAIFYTIFSIHNELNYRRELEDKLAIELGNKVVPTVADEMSRLIKAGDYSKCEDLNDLFNKLKSK